MTTKTFIKGWKTGVFSLIVLTLLFIGAIGCQSDAASDVTGEPQGVEYPIPEGAKTRMTVAFLIKEGQTLWFDVQGRGDIVNLGSPQGYYLPKDIKNHAHYYQLLEQTTQQIEELVTTNGGGRDYNTHLKITLGDYNPDLKATPIIKVEKPTKEEWQVLMQKEEVVREKSSQKTAKVGLRTAMTKGAAQAFFRLFKSISCDRYSGTPCLTFQYAPDGCHARAHYMRKLLEGNGYACQKIFAIEELGGLQAYANVGCCVQWKWHVAPVVKVRDGSSITPMVIDPSICDEPVLISTWINAMKTGCADGRRVNISTTIRPSSDYFPLGNGYYYQDPDYSLTEDLLEQYRNKSGCVEY